MGCACCTTWSESSIRIQRSMQASYARFSVPLPFKKKSTVEFVRYGFRATLENNAVIDMYVIRVRNTTATQLDDIIAPLEGALESAIHETTRDLTIIVSVFRILSIGKIISEDAIDAAPRP